MLQINWNYIKIVVLLGVVAFLYAFASKRNESRKVSNPIVRFIGDNNFYISNEAVSKLLIQNYKQLKNQTKETLALNKLENALKSNAMIKTAEVYLSVNGTLNAIVKQRRPIARVSSNPFYYIDDEGVSMPLSNNYSARVPLVTGSFDEKDLKMVFKVAHKIENDDFLKKNVIEIHKSDDDIVYLKLRQYNFKVKIGDLSFLDKKINNLKAFYKKNLKDKTLNKYSKVNLQFDNQVICTKI